MVRRVIDLAVGETRPDLTLIFLVSVAVSEKRRTRRQTETPIMRDRIEEAGAGFFERVAQGYEAILAEEPQRVRRVDGSAGIDEIRETVWGIVQPLIVGPGAASRRS
jgi:dTMP kinase